MRSIPRESIGRAGRSVPGRVAAHPSPSPSVGVATARPARPSPALPDGVTSHEAQRGADCRGRRIRVARVASHRGSLLYRIDPDTNAIEAQIVMGTEQCGELAFGDELVWVHSCGNFNSSFRVDPPTNAVVGSDRWPGLSVGFGAGSLWAVLEYSTPGAVGQFELGTYELEKRIPVGAGPTYLSTDLDRRG